MMKYLTEGGMLIFPVLSLSNEEKILQAVKRAYQSYDLVLKKDWFLPDDIANKTGMSSHLKNLLNFFYVSLKCFYSYSLPSEALGMLLLALKKIFFFYKNVMQ